MIRDALIVNKKSGEIINRIAHDDNETYSPPKNCILVFDDELTPEEREKLKNDGNF